MRLHRFYTTENLGGKGEIRIEDEKMLHQLRDVFRLKAGDELVLFAGDGVDHRCKMSLLSKKEGVFEKIGEERSYIPERKVTLLMSVIKKENFELACEKATEIGVSKIVPIMTERTLAKNLNMERLQRIVIEASEQCGRGDIPTLGETTDLGSAIINYENIIAFDLSGENLSDLNIPEPTSARSTDRVLGSPRGLGQTIGNTSPLEILIGPEGGWSDEEMKLLKDKNITIAKLGDTTLRSETAAIVASAKVIGIL